MTKAERVARAKKAAAASAKVRSKKARERRKAEKGMQPVPHLKRQEGVVLLRECLETGKTILGRHFRVGDYRVLQGKDQGLPNYCFFNRVEGEKTMRTVECSACGAPAKVARGSYEFAECGLRHVMLEGIDLIRCGNCKNVDPIIPRLNELMSVVAFALIRKPCGLVGQEVRFLRKYLGMTGEEFARLLHVDKTTLSKWENGDDPVGGQSDRLIRLIALALGKGLNERLLEVNIRTSFPQIKDARRKLPIHINPAKMSYQYA